MKHGFPKTSLLPCFVRVQSVANSFGSGRRPRQVSSAFNPWRSPHPALTTKENRGFCRYARITASEVKQDICAYPLLCTVAVSVLLPCDLPEVAQRFGKNDGRDLAEGDEAFIFR